MNMREPTTAWDRAPTDAELNAYYGKEKSNRVRDEIIETLTATIRKVPHAKLCVPFVSYRGTDYGILRQSPIDEVVTDHCADTEPLAALMAVLERSDCPLVAAYRKALATAYADAWANAVEALSEE